MCERVRERNCAQSLSGDVGECSLFIAPLRNPKLRVGGVIQSSEKYQRASNIPHTVDKIVPGPVQCTTQHGGRLH